MPDPTPEPVEFYRLPATAALKSLESRRGGLSTPEANARRLKSGPNILIELGRERWWQKLLRQFKDLMVLLLLGSSLISLLLGDGRTAAVLAALALVNAIIGFSQEFKADRLMASLQQLTVSLARVKRDGSMVELDSTELVTGDIVYIEAGDAVPADLRLISESELSTNDFALTGESNPARKFSRAVRASLPLANRHNMAYMGTTVATGNAWGLVVATGMQTELGRIANLSHDLPASLSPLQRELNNVASRVTAGTVILCLLLLPLIIYLGLGFKNALLYAIAIASSIIPQGLPAEINTNLARAASRLARARALVKRLSAVEGLGACSVICTDKTGTLTKNQMTVERLLVSRQLYNISGRGYSPEGQWTMAPQNRPLARAQLDGLQLLLATGVLASNARLKAPHPGHPEWYVLGDPTEGALLTLAQKAGLDPDQLEGDHPELREFAFDSARKRMSSIRAYGSNKLLFAFVKGAPETVLAGCEDIWDHGHVRPITPTDRQAITESHSQWATQAYRNLGLAYKVLPKNTAVQRIKLEQAESGLTWLGLVGMVDPLREEIPAAMAAARGAHIRVCLITGDHADTARAVALKAGMTTANRPVTVVGGDEIKDVSDHDLTRLAAAGGTIFSRVSPEDKLRIVNCLKNSGHVVAVTGDGINDAPALKRADIGVAMGLSGTDVAKQSAEIVLLDDSFATLVSAIRQGRVIFQNIKKGTLSCFTSNFAELVVSLASLLGLALAGLPLALSVMQILAIDMVAELFPIAALGWDKADGQLMSERPRAPSDHILNRRAVMDLTASGLVMGGLAYANYVFYFWRHDVPVGQVKAAPAALYASATALTYLTIVLCQLFNVLQRRSHDGLFSRYQLHNKALAIAVIFSLFAVVNIIYNPLIAPYFGSGPLSASDWLLALTAAMIFVTIREARRYADRHHHRDHIMAMLSADA